MKMSEILKRQYDAVFSVPLSSMMTASDIFDQNVATEDSSLTDIIFEPSDIEEAINELSQNSAAGPDQFPAFLLKRCKKEMGIPLHIIWKKSLV